MISPIGLRGKAQSFQFFLQWLPVLAIRFAFPLFLLLKRWFQQGLLPGASKCEQGSTRQSGSMCFRIQRSKFHEQGNCAGLLEPETDLLGGRRGAVPCVRSKSASG